MGDWARFLNCYVTPGSSGLLDSGGRCIYQSVHRKRSLQDARWFSPPSDLEKLPSLAPVLPRIVFLPFLQFGHFGHLLTETAGWLSPLLSPKKPGALPDHFLLGALAASSSDALCNVLNLQKSKVHTTMSLRVATHLPEVWVPLPSMVNRDHIAPRHCRAVKRLLRRMHDLPRHAFRHVLPASSKGNLLYLSRSALAPVQRCIDGESRLEMLLQQLGWTVIHPELMPLVEQVRHLREAVVVAGPLGSAFHLLLPFGFLSDGPLVLTLGVANELTMAGPSQNFALQFAQQHLPFEHLPVLRSSHPTSEPSALPRNANLQFAVPPEQVAQQLQRLAQAFTSTLPQ